MTIKIVDEPDLKLSRAEYERLLHEYNQSLRGRAGPIPSFETWARSSRPNEIGEE
jgi:hypothetical protein